jgi:hypothetical protein
VITQQQAEQARQAELAEQEALTRIMAELEQLSEDEVHQLLSYRQPESLEK